MIGARISLKAFKGEIKKTLMAEMSQKCQFQAGKVAPSLVFGTFTNRQKYTALGIQ